MRLVNVEDLKVLVAVDSKGEIRYGKLVTDLFEDIPAVNAIPIEWIEQYMNRFRLDMAVSNEYVLLHSMLTEWEIKNVKV